MIEFLFGLLILAVLLSFPAGRLLVGASVLTVGAFALWAFSQ